MLHLHINESILINFGIESDDILEISICGEMGTYKLEDIIKYHVI
jgi:hypothetical protein